MSSKPLHQYIHKLYYLLFWLVSYLKTGPNGSIVLAYQANLTLSARTGVVVVDAPGGSAMPRNLTVTQAPCTLGLPGNVTAAVDASAGAVNLTWTAAEGATSYNIYRDGPNDLLLATVTGLSFTVVPGAPPLSGCAAMSDDPTSHGFWVAAVNECGIGTAVQAAVIAKNEVLERVFPRAKSEDGAQIAGIDSPLAIRLRADEPIAPESVWGIVRAGGVETDVVVWLPVEEAEGRDGWVLHTPQEPWAAGETVTMIAGAETVSGELVGPRAYVFKIEADEDAEKSGPEATVWQPVAGVDYSADGPIPAEVAVVMRDAAAAPLAGGLGPVHAVGPDQVFEQPVWVWLPVPANLEPRQVALYYCIGCGEDARWHPAESVDGWLTPADALRLDIGGTAYVGFEVRHGGTVQFGSPGLLAERQGASLSPLSGVFLAGRLGDVIVMGLSLAMLGLFARGRVNSAAGRGEGG